MGRWLVGLPAAVLPAGLALPALSALGDPQHAGPLYFVTCLAVAVAFAAVGIRLSRGSRAAAVVGVAIVAVASLLLEQASYPGAAAVVAAALGWGIGALVEWPPERRWQAISGLIGGCETLVLLRFGAGVWQAGLALTAIALWCCWRSLGRPYGQGPGRRMKTTALLPSPAHGRGAGGEGLRPGGPNLRSSGGQSHAPGRAPRAAYLGVAGLLALFSAFWVGSTSPSVEWFGQLTYHGPRDRNEVALTFDDGPNGAATAQIGRFLADRGVHATFFLVGKAVVRDPGTATALLSDGHIVANHSYNHDATSYLDPSYPELMQTQRVIAERVGVCPAFFRPPHGTHTWFMSRIVSDHGMRLVTWDVSAKDWVEDDAVRLAKNILAKVKPGSIILLHDGIDGIPPVDRSVVVKALPAILDGLKARGLKPVTLDVLLGTRPYLSLSECLPVVADGAAR